MAIPTTVLASRTGDPTRPFTEPTLSDGDLELLTRLHASLAEHAAVGAADGRWTDPAGGRHWLVVPDWAALRATAPAIGVGFFGQALDVDHAPITVIEHEMLERLERYPGLLAYYNVEWPQGEPYGAVLRRLGVGPEVCVGLATGRTPYMVVGILGIFKAGGAHHEKFDIIERKY